MRDRRRQLAQDEHRIHSNQVGPRLLQRVLEPYALGDVIVGLEDHGSAPGRIPLQSETATHDARGAVGATPGELAFPAIVLMKPVNDLLERYDELRVEQCVHDLAYGRCPVEAVQCFGATAPVEDLPAHVPRKESIARQFEQVGLISVPLFCAKAADSEAFPLGAQPVDPSITTHEIFDPGKLAEACLLLRARIMQSKLEARKITLSMLAAAQEAKLPFGS
nr:hypothetical protein [Paraburkholderia sp. UCT31]